jgi:hypothetical protein
MIAMAFERVSCVQRTTALRTFAVRNGRQSHESGTVKRASGTLPFRRADYGGLTNGATREGSSTAVSDRDHRPELRSQDGIENTTWVLLALKASAMSLLPTRLAG